MPLYDYHCKKCGDTVEVFVKLADVDKPILCSRHGTEMERILGGAPGFKLKGAGFHTNDYGKEYGGR